MRRPNWGNVLALAGIFLLAWLSLKYLLPLVIPFLLGGLLALAAEPVVHLLTTRLRLPRAAAVGIGISATLLFLLCLLVLLTGLLVKQLGLLANVLPDLANTAKSGFSSLEGFLTNLAQNAPSSIQPILSQSVNELVGSGNAVVSKMVEKIPPMATAFLGHISDSALAIGTGILAAFMVSVRLPLLKSWWNNLPSSHKVNTLLPTLKSIRKAVGEWLKAQLKLSGLCFCILLAGFLLLRIPYAPIWAAVVALVDAIPILGTGTVLVPWALISFIRGQTIQAIGMLGICLTAMLSRSFLEPRLVGKHLGLDPLMTLVTLYIGYRLWGIAGMLLSPLLCVTATELLRVFPKRFQ